MNLNQLFGNQPKKNFALHEVILGGGDRISRWNMIFLVSSGKMAFLFLKNMMFFSRRKVKDGVLCVFGKGGVSFPYKHEITLLSEKQGLSSPEKYT